MTSYKWSISELNQFDGLVTQVKYRCEASKGEFVVATEGYWKFRKKNAFSPEITENQVANWVDLDAQEGERHMIKTRLDEQLAALENAESCDPPWKVETFKVSL